MILGTRHTRLPYPIQVGIWLWSMDTRALELTFGLLILLRGIMLYADPNSMDAEVYSQFVSTMSRSAWSQVCILAGAFQMAGVFINGNWRKSPWLRFSGATVSAIFYAMMASLFMTADPALATTTYAPMAFAMIWTALNIASKQ